MGVHESVEIKVTLSESVPEAMKTLQLGGGSSLQIWFLDDLTPGLRRPLPLFAAGVILRLRSKDDEDDSTVKLRPCRRSQLTSRWAKNDAHDAWEYRIEGDWAGTSRSLAASSVLTLHPGQVAKALADGADPGAVFNARQLELLDDCADLRINLPGLTPMGPISATKWKNVRLGDAAPEGAHRALEVDAERWVVGAKDFLELSIRVKPAEADPEHAKVAFETAVRRAGLSFSQLETSKTEQVLTHLATRTASAPTRTRTERQ